MRAMPRTMPLLILLAISPLALAQAPHEAWQTIRTAHFRVHYPKSSETWAMQVASTIESVRDAVVKEVGFAPAQTTDIVIGNPQAASNGMTLPLLDTPRIVLWTEPPAPESQIGEYTSWPELLTVHEMAHLVHLLRPSRDPLTRLLERWLPLNPITLAAPRWILEGYATVVEGRITGSGRPPGAIRAAILREWAATGQFPSYDALNGTRTFVGGAMPYLAGSAFLEWLEMRRGPGALRDLWARMTARQRRSFDTAFEGVFGDSPRKLYGEFVASVTAEAVSVLRAAPAEQGTVWQKTRDASGDPAVSMDGKQIAVVIRSRTQPSKIVIWSTEAATEEEKKDQERIAKMIARDPQDVAPRSSGPLPRKPKHTYVAPDGRDMQSPRWMPDGSILFSRRQPDRDGFLHHDLFRWFPESGRAVRVTHLADVFDADPYPDGLKAIAVRNRDGKSQLVTVDLTTGNVTNFTSPAASIVYAHPRVKCDVADRRGLKPSIVAAVHQGGIWQIVYIVNSSSFMPIAQNAASPEWAGDNIVATVFHNGFIDLRRFDRRGFEATGEAGLTRMVGAAFDPAPSPDGRIFFMSLEPDGFVLRVLEGAKAVAPRPPVIASPPVVPPLRQTPVAFASQPVTPEPYGIGRQEFATVIGANVAPSMHTSELGVRFGDVVGRLDTIALASLGSGDAPHGFAIASAWRGWPVAISAHAYRVTELRERETGAELRGRWTATFPLHSIDLAAGALLGDQHLGFLEASTDAHQVRGTMRMREEIALSGESGSDRHHARARASASIDFGSFALAVQYQRDRSNAAAPVEAGGLISSIMPRSSRANRIADPALPFRTLASDRYSGTRIEANLGGITLFHQQHRAGESVRLAGIEIAGTTPPVPLVKLPALDVTLGGAHVYDSPLRGRNKFWIGMRWEP